MAVYIKPSQPLPAKFAKHVEWGCVQTLHLVSGEGLVWTLGKGAPMGSENQHMCVDSCLTRIKLTLGKRKGGDRSYRHWIQSHIQTHRERGYQGPGDEWDSGWGVSWVACDPRLWHALRPKVTQVGHVLGEPCSWWPGGEPAKTSEQSINYLDVQTHVQRRQHNLKHQERMTRWVGTWQNGEGWSAAVGAGGSKRSGGKCSPWAQSISSIRSVLSHLSI